MNLLIYARGKMTSARYGWMTLRIGSLHNNFNFDSYDFKIDGVVYTHDSAEWQEALTKLQVWEVLSDED